MTAALLLFALGTWLCYLGYDMGLLVLGFALAAGYGTRQRDRRAFPR